MSKFTNAPTTSLKGLVAGCMIKLLLAAVITLLFQVSLMSIATGVGTKEIGYRVLYSADNKEYKEVYLHLYADGEDTQLEKYQQDPHYYKVAERSTLNPGTVLAVNAVACGFGLVLLYFSIYTALWRAGDALANKADFNGTTADSRFGLKVGLLADIPVILLYLAVIVCKLAGGLSPALTAFKITNYYCFAYADLFITKVNGALTASAAGILGLLPVLLVLPALCAFSYRLGQKHFVLKNALVYSKTKTPQGGGVK